MSRSFAAVETFLERILERPAARLFHAHPQPVQLERRIERVMTAQRMVQGGHTYVPSRYRVILHPDDLAALHVVATGLQSDLAEGVLQRARLQGFWLLARPEVSLIASARITQGDLEVAAEPLDPVLVRSTASGLRPVGLEGPKPPRPPIPGTDVVSDPPPIPGSRRVMAIIDIEAPDRPPQRVVFDGTTLRVGRGSDNDIVIVDERISRHHGRFQARHGSLPTRTWIAPTAHWSTGCVSTTSAWEWEMRSALGAPR